MVRQGCAADVRVLETSSLSQRPEAESRTGAVKYLGVEGLSVPGQRAKSGMLRLGNNILNAQRLLGVLPACLHSWTMTISCIPLLYHCP